MNKKLKIFKEGDPELRVKCKPVKYVFREQMDLALDMCTTMIAANGIGLSANQVGKDIQLLVIDTSYTEYGGTSAIMFNPEILHGEGTVLSKEGCLSIPGKTVEIERYKKIKVKYLNIQNNDTIRMFEGLAAIAIQHEMDHLNGIILSDHEKKDEK